MSWFTYKKVLLPNGDIGYQRVPISLEEAQKGEVLLPELAPDIKAGEIAGEPSIVELLKVKTKAAARRRLLSSRDAQPRNESKPLVAPFRRLIEP